MAIELIDEETFNQGTQIKVIGVGGGGGNAVAHMIASAVQGLERETGPIGHVPVRGFGPVLLPIHLFCDHQPFERGNGYRSAIFGPGPDHGLPFRQEQKTTAPS